MIRRRTRIIDDTLLFAGALFVRLLYGFSIRGTALFELPRVDAALFREEALRLLSGGGMETVFYKPPLFTWLLAALGGLFGDGAGTARFAMLALSALAAPAAASLARPLIGRFGALLAGAFTALYAPALFYGGELLPASTVLLLNLAMLLALRRAEESERPRLFGAAGVTLGLSALARPTILLFLPLLLVRYRRNRLAAMLLLAGAVVAILPATIHNAVGGDFVPVSSNGGINFYMGNHEGADGWSARAPELPNEPGEARRAARALAEREEGRPLRSSEVSAFWYRRAFVWITSDPAGALSLAARKTYALLNDRDISDNIDIRAVEELSRPLRWTPFRFGLLFALAIPGMIVLYRTRGGRLLLLYAAAAALPMILFFAVGRFRIPLLPILAVGAAAGTIAIGSSIRKSPRQAVLFLLLAATAFSLSTSTLFSIDEDRTWHYHYLAGDAHFRQGEVDDAVGAFEEAYRRNDRVPIVRNALGFLYAERGIRLERAEELIRGAIELEPARRRFYLDSLGWVLYRQGRLEAAAAVLEEAIPLFAPEETYSREEAERHLAEVRAAME